MLLSVQDQICVHVRKLTNAFDNLTSPDLLCALQNLKSYQKDSYKTLFKPSQKKSADGLRKICLSSSIVYWHKVQKKCTFLSPLVECFYSLQAFPASFLSLYISFSELHSGKDHKLDSNC